MYKNVSDIHNTFYKNHNLILINSGWMFSFIGSGRTDDAISSIYFVIQLQVQCIEFRQDRTWFHFQFLIEIQDFNRFEKSPATSVRFDDRSFLWFLRSFTRFNVAKDTSIPQEFVCFFDRMGGLSITHKLICDFLEYQSKYIPTIPHQIRTKMRVNNKSWNLFFPCSLIEFLEKHTRT